MTPIEAPIETPTQSAPVNSWNQVPETRVAAKQEEVEDTEFYIKETEETQVHSEISWDFNESSKQVTEEVVADTKEEVVRHYLTDDAEEVVELENNVAKTVLSPEQQKQRSMERMERIQSYTSKMKTSNGIADLENEPAYKRRDVKFEDVEHSSDNNRSRYSVNETNENGQSKIGLKTKQFIFT